MTLNTSLQTPGFGESVEHEWQTVRSWQSFTNLFEDAVKLEGVTYCESPSLLQDLLTSPEFSLESIELLVGDRDEYRSSIDNVAVARQLQDLYTDGRLTVYLKKRKVDHSKLYRAVEPDGDVTLIVGSANLSYNSWKNQANSLVIYRTQEGSVFDEEFKRWLREHWEDYGDEVFLADLVGQLEQLDDQEERDQFIELWIDNRVDRLSERGSVHTDLSQELEEVGREVARAVELNNEEGTELRETKNESDEKASLVQGGVETENITDDGAIAEATTPEMTIKLSTQSFDTDGYAGSLRDHLQRRGAKVSANSMSIPIETYTNYLEEQYDQWEMWIDDEERRVHLQIGEHHRILTAQEDPSPDTLDTALENIEDYVETVARWGETNHENAVMAHMYEGILYGLWAPLINLYAESFHGKSTLDKSLPYLFIFGSSDAGKDQFTKFVLQLVSGGMVKGGSDGDEFTNTKVRTLREIDTSFPFVVSDIKKKRIEAADTLRNFWGDSWNPDLGISYPAIIFTSNDSRPNEWFRNRAKMLNFDVVFPSNPTDEGFHEAQRDLNSILNEKNPIFSYVSREILYNEPYRVTTGTINDVREIISSFYDRAGRDKPSYFPEQRAAEITYNIGKRKWENAYHRGAIDFEQHDDIDGHLIAKFDLESHEVYEYEKIVPKQMRPEKSGRTILIKNPNAFLDWLDINPLSSSGASWLSWFRRKV